MIDWILDFWSYQDEDDIDVPYRQAFGTLMYEMIGSRLDLKMLLKICPKRAINRSGNNGRGLSEFFDLSMVHET